MGTFMQEFFSVYDRKIASGEIRFSELGISKDDFTSLCTDEGFRFSREKLADICMRMKLTEEEKEKLIRSSECKK